MKKSKLSIGLVTSFIAAMAMSACTSDVKPDGNALVTFKPYGGGSEISILTDDMYNDYILSNAGATKFYEKILEVLTRYEFQVSKTGEGSVVDNRTLASIESEVKNNIKSMKDDAARDAKSNKTSYDTEWEKILESNNVETEKELKEKLIYDLEKKEIEDWYFDSNKETLTKEFIGVDKEGKAVQPAEGYGTLTSKLPYHIRHILVKNEDGASNYTGGTLSKEQAENLFKVVNKLVKGKQTFGRIANENSEDDGSAKLYGNLNQILDNTVSEEGNFTMVPEFQLGIYAYDAILSRKSNVVINDGLGLGENDKIGENKVADLIKNNTTFAPGSDTIVGLNEVPYSVFEDLDTYADTTADAAGHTVLASTSESAIYPRNVLWNKYLNRHNPFIITNRNRTSIAGLTSVDQNSDPNTLESGYDTTSTIFADKMETPNVKKCGFASAYALGLTETDTGMRVLTDENNNIILGIRSQYGIHFTVIEKSIFDFGDEVSLVDYYTTKKPGEEGYPQTASGEDMQTFVNFLKTEDQGKMDEMATIVETAIKGFDPTFSYRLYEYLVAKYSSKLTFREYNGVKMDEVINDYIQLQREKASYTQEIGFNKAWTDYLAKIEEQNIERENSLRMVKEGCVIGFMKDLEALKSTNPALYAAYQKGGACYYGNAK